MLNKYLLALLLMTIFSQKNNAMQSLSNSAVDLDKEKILQDRIAYMTAHPDYFLECCYVGDIEIIKRVLPQWDSAQRSRINTGMMAAIQRGHVNLVKLLLENGAHTNIQTRLLKDTPIIAALKQLHNNAENHTEIIKALIHYGAHIDKHNKYHETALHWCADLGNIAILKQLLCESFFEPKRLLNQAINQEPHSLKLQCVRYVIRNQSLHNHDDLNMLMNNYAMIYDDIAGNIPLEQQKKLIASLKLEHHTSSHLNRLLSAHCQRHLVCIKHELDKKTTSDKTPLMQAQKNNHHDCAYFIRSVQKAEHFRQLDLELRQRIVANIAQKLDIDLVPGVD